MDRRRELGEFLRAKRALVSLPDEGGWGSTRRRVPGLRREEVAELALISTTYYTKLERGKVAGISAAVLDGLVSALHLTTAERMYVARLIPVAGVAVTPAEQPDEDAVGDQLLRLLDALLLPAHVQNDRGDLLAANAPGRALYPFHFEDPRPNTLRFLFLDPRARTFFADWERWADQGVHFLRAGLARTPNDERLAALVHELRAESPDFADAWDTHEVVWETSGTRGVHHPDVGPLDLDFQNLAVVGQPRLRLTVYSGAPGTSTADGLNRLALRAAGGH